MGSLPLLLREPNVVEKVPSLGIPELRASLSLPAELACSRKGKNPLVVFTSAGWLYDAGPPFLWLALACQRISGLGPCVWSPA